jgi:hypothetical protein
MKVKLISLFLLIALFGCTTIEDNTMISFQGSLVSRNGTPIENVKIELVKTSIGNQEQLQNLGFEISDIDKLDVVDISNDEGIFQFFFPRSTLDLALYIDVDQQLNFHYEDLERSYPLLIIRDTESLDSDFGKLTLTPSE